MSFTRRDQLSLCEAYTSIYRENAGKNVDITQDQAAALIALVAKAVDGDPEAIKIVTGKATAELEQAIKQQAPSGKPVNEAFERLRAKYGAKLMGDDPIRRRYDLFLKDVNGHLWEVKQDARKLNVQPDMVDGFISNIISIEPAVQEKGKLLQKIGYGAGSIIGRFAFVTPFVAAASFLGPLVGATGLAIPAISAALAGGGQTAIMLTNKQLTRKEKILNVVATMVSAFGLSKAAESLLREIPPPKPTGGGGGSGYSGDGKIGFDYDPIDPNKGGFNPDQIRSPYEGKMGFDGGSGGSSIDPDAGGFNPETIGVPTPSINDADIIKDWPELSRTVFGRMTDSGTPTYGAPPDETALALIKQDLINKGLTWNKLSMAKKAEIFNPIAQKILKR